ncbi:hypothetical protein D3C87_1252850 [compost metagenome]
MNYFERFNRILEERFKGDLQATLNSSGFDTYRDRPIRIVEIDRRPKKEPVYVTIPEPVVEPEVNEDIDFAVIDLEAEMERRRKSTETNNPVQPEPTIEDSKVVPLSLTVRDSTKSTSRGSVLQKKKSQTTKTSFTATGGNRAQRRAAKALMRKGGNTSSSSTRKDDERNSGGSQKADAPKRVSLSELEFGFRLE